MVGLVGRCNEVLIVECSFYRVMQRQLDYRFLDLYTVSIDFEGLASIVVDLLNVSFVLLQLFSFVLDNIPHTSDTTFQN